MRVLCITSLLPAVGNNTQFAPCPQLAGAPLGLAHTLHSQLGWIYTCKYIHTEQEPWNNQAKETVQCI